jgi:hypothetical protein
MPDEKTVTLETLSGRIDTLDKLIADFSVAIAALGTGLSDGLAARDNAIAAVAETLAKDTIRFEEYFARIEADIATLNDRPSDIATLDGALTPNETQHVRAVLERFKTDAPPYDLMHGI